MLSLALNILAVPYKKLFGIYAVLAKVKNKSVVLKEARPVVDYLIPGPDIRFKRLEGSVTIQNHANHCSFGHSIVS